MNSLNATETADSSFLAIPATDRPPTCGGPIPAKCLPSSLTSSWDSLYATMLGLMNDDNTLLVRNSQLQAQPFGTPIDMNALSYFTSFYGQDTWRIRPSLTLTYGLSYSFQTPYNFVESGRGYAGQCLPTTKSSRALTYLQNKLSRRAAGTDLQSTARLRAGRAVSADRAFTTPTMATWLRAPLWHGVRITTAAFLEKCWAVGRTVFPRRIRNLLQPPQQRRQRSHCRV